MKCASCYIRRECCSRVSHVGRLPTAQSDPRPQRLAEQCFTPLAVHDGLDATSGCAGAEAPASKNIRCRLPRVLTLLLLLLLGRHSALVSGPQLNTTI